MRAPEDPYGALFAYVEKPSRYLGQEINAVHKDPADVVLRAGLVFPDLYEVAMAHLGTQILYGLGNELEGVQVERVFLPGQDLLTLLDAHGLPLSTLESRTPLGECHLLGITLQSELTFTNILTVLDVAGIPLKASERLKDEPVILGGGPCAFNPEPLADFFDLFYLGDAEDQWGEILRVLRDQVLSGAGRIERIDALKEIPGIYCPADYEPQYASDGTLIKVDRQVQGVDVSPCVTRSLDVPLPASSYVVPFLPPVHDRVNIEATRGCTRGCRFCHAGMVTRPTREKGAEQVVASAEKALHLTGYEDLALTSLSIGDYGPLDEVLETVMDSHGRDRISMSLPSIRIGGLTPSVARQILRVRRTGFTIAPEAGTRRLRKVINKDFSDEEILRTVRWVFEHGWDSVKCYFMIGLPTETDEDLQGIVDLAKTVAARAPNKGKVTINLSPFVPKAHTPFQWAGQDPEPEMKRKLMRLRKDLTGAKIQVRWSRTDQALLEACLSRGDRRLARVIEAAWRLGAVMDGWEEHFDWGIWEQAFNQEGLDPQWSAGRERSPEEVLPWDHISCGVSREYLLREYRKGLSGEVTPDCREAGCMSCGACTPDQIKELPPLRRVPGIPDIEPLPPVQSPEAERPVRRIRLVFTKTGDLRFLGHLEMARLFERACRRAGVPLAFSGGYSPKARINFALSLPTGTEALAEWVDLELAQAWPPEKVCKSLNSQLPRGIEVRSAWKVPVDVPALNSRVRSMTYKALLPEPIKDLDKKAARLMERSSVPFVRVKKGKKRTLDLKEFLLRLETEGDRSVEFTLELKGEKGSARPQEVIQILTDIEEETLADVRMTRTGLSFALEQDKAGGRPGMARVWD
jgi:radical SAM family uncharacterized protein/radical SAM-linked protein